MSNIKQNLAAAAAIFLSHGGFVTAAMPDRSVDKDLEARLIPSPNRAYRMIQSLGGSGNHGIALDPNKTPRRELKGKRRSSSSKASKSSSASKTSKSSKSSKSSKKGSTSDSSDDVVDVFDLLSERDDEFSTFLNAATLAGRDDELMEQRRQLQSSTGITVFAPTNAAFASAGDAISRYFDTDIWSNAHIRAVVDYHINFASAILSTDFVEGQTVIPEPETTPPSDVTVSLTDPPTLDSLAISTPVDIIESDNIASNGVFHVVDQVLTPLLLAVDVITAAASSPDFSNFLELIVAADLVTFLQGDGPFQVFAVPNAVFDGYQAALTAAGLDIDFLQMLKDDPDLVTIVQNHIVQGQVICSCSSASEGTYASVANIDLVISNVNPPMNSFDINGAERVQGFIVSNAGIGVIDDFLFPPGLPTFLP